MYRAGMSTQGTCSLQGLFAVPATDVRMSFLAQDQYFKHLLPSLLNTAAIPGSAGKL